MTEPNAAPTSVLVDHFSDVLCVWAHGAQIRVDELRAQYGARVAVRYRFVPVFANTAKKIGVGWAARGGWAEYTRHVRTVAGRFPHVTMSPDAWERVRPASSASAHLFLKAVQAIEGAGPSPAGGLYERTSAALRVAFFAEARDIATRAVQLEIAEQVGAPRAAIEEALANGSAMAALFEDVEAQTTQRIEGSPTLVLNEGRQKLYGNVGYRVIEANVEELLRAPSPQSASWC
jgi:predicted DsbA family dithiol-disulfide isomerase